MSTSQKLWKAATRQVCGEFGVIFFLKNRLMYGIWIMRSVFSSEIFFKHPTIRKTHVSEGYFRNRYDPSKMRVRVQNRESRSSRSETKSWLFLSFLLYASNIQPPFRPPDIHSTRGAQTIICHGMALIQVRDVKVEYEWKKAKPVPTTWNSF